MSGRPRRAREGERTTVTACSSSDCRGSTELMRDLDPEQARAIVDPVLQLMMAAVHRYGGYVAQSLGDGIFAMFGAPWPTRTIRSAHFVRHWRCRRSCVATPTVYARRARFLSKHGWG